MEPTEPEQESISFELHRASFWTPGMIFFVAVASLFSLDFVAILVEALSGNLESDVVRQALVGFGVSAAALLLVVGRRGYLYSRPLPPITFHPGHLLLPLSIHSARVREVAYRDILSVGTRGFPPKTDLFIESRRTIFLFPIGSFREPAELERVAVELSKRIEALPEGEEMIADADRRSRLAEEAFSIRPIVTQALLGMIFVLFFNQYLLSGSDTSFGLLRWGALYAPLVFDGQWFRLASANFLHLGLLHLLVNSLALYVLGTLLERLLGWARFLVLYLGAGLAATIASTLAIGSISVGASGAIFGLFGGLAVANWRYREQLPFGFRQSLRWWIVILSINALIPVVPILLPNWFPQIDVTAHVAGLAAGALLGFGFFPVGSTLNLGKRSGLPIQALAAALVLVFAAGIGLAVRYAASFDNQAKESIMAAFVRDDSIGPQQLNEVAWFVSIDKEATEVSLAMAQSLVSRAIEAEPDEAMFKDTLATVRFRLGDLDLAVEGERPLLEQQTHPSYATQLARFLVARRDRDGVKMPSQLAVGAVSMELAAKPDGGRAILLQTHETLNSPLTVYATAMRGSQLLGLVTVVVASGEPRTSSFDVEGGELDPLTLKRATVQLAAIYEDPGRKPKSGDVEWKFWPADAEVVGYP